MISPPREDNDQTITYGGGLDDSLLRQIASGARSLSLPLPLPLPQPQPQPQEEKEERKKTQRVRVLGIADQYTLSEYIKNTSTSSTSSTSAKTKTRTRTQNQTQSKSKGRKRDTSTPSASAHAQAAPDTQQKANSVLAAVASWLAHQKKEGQNWDHDKKEKGDLERKEDDDNAPHNRTIASFMDNNTHNTNDTNDTHSHPFSIVSVEWVVQCLIAGVRLWVDDPLAQYSNTSTNTNASTGTGTGDRNRTRDRIWTGTGAGSWTGTGSWSDTSGVFGIPSSYAVVCISCYMQWRYRYSDDDG